ncbi:hypothetical protein PTI45_00294 [Paenibacillus nuruki]|uniref:Uncharacterized protein n=1 Tax=Paenibacillus nuruki TaxID=1886670 RepID=A0A1E3L9A8_9BACL|nr:hypothetical protein [Paenibacillus nuruki]ODP30224.1 hypothetical protein PTI45_00294 [Paenibacillus nuruki]
MRILTVVFKGIWIIAITINVLSLLWLVVGSTANFQSSMDIVARYTLFSVGIFSIILISLSIFYLIKTKKQNIGIAGCAVALVFSLFLLGCSSMNQEGVVDKEWFRDSVNKDPIKSTTDGKYDYRLKIINRGQKNVRQQLYVKELATKQEKYIDIPIKMEPSYGYSLGTGDWAWARLKNTDHINEYILTTTSELGVPIQSFKMNTYEGSADSIFSQ